MIQLKLYSIYWMLYKFGFTCTSFVYTARLVEKFGFTNQQVMSLNFIYFTSSLLLEVPTGIISDRFGAKKAISLGAFCWFLGAVGYTYGSNYYHFALCEIVCAIGAAFLSGASDCWVGGHFNDYQKLVTYRSNLNQKIRILSVILTLAVGLYADKASLDFPYYIAGLMFLMSFVVTLLFDNHVIDKEHKIPSFNQSLKFYFSNIRLSSLGLLALSNMLWLAPVFMLWGPVMRQDMQLNTSWMAIGSSVLSIGMVAGGIMERKLETILNRNKYLTEIALQVLKGISIVLLAVNIKSGIGVFLLCFFVVEIFHEASMQFHFNHVHKFYIGRPDEATIGSIHSLLGRMGGGLGNLCLGYFADSYGRQYSWIISGVMMACTAIIIYFTVRTVEKH